MERIRKTAINYMVSKMLIYPNVIGTAQENEVVKGPF